jgi:hypothetical protein
MRGLKLESNTLIFAVMSDNQINLLVSDLEIPPDKEYSQPLEV